MAERCVASNLPLYFRETDGLESAAGNDGPGAIPGLLCGLTAQPPMLQLPPPSTQKRAQCGWLSFTSRAESARLAPSSNSSS